MKEKILNFMRGRYGSDELNILLMLVWVVIAIVKIFVRASLVGLILNLITLAIAITVLFRMLSRNIAARQKENAPFKPIMAKLLNKLAMQKRKYDERDTHRYIKCPKCKAVLRVPYKKGTHTTKCPKCGERFETTIK